MSPLHQGARRGVEVVVTRGAGDRERGHGAGCADGETHAHHALRAACARGGRIKHAAANGGAHLPTIGRKRGSARRCARGRACRGRAARRLGGSGTGLRLSTSRRRSPLRRRSRLRLRGFDAPGRRRLRRRGLNCLRRRGRRRRKLDRSWRRRWRLWPRWRKRLLDGRGRLLGDRRRCRLRRGKRRLLDRRWRLLLDDRRRGRLVHGWRLLLDDGRRRSCGGGQQRLRLHRRLRRLLGDRRCHRGWRRLGRSRRGVLSRGRRGLVGRLLLLGRGRRRFGGRRFRLDIDDHFSRLLGRFPRLQIDDRKRRGVERDHDQDDERTEPRRPNRGLEAAPVQSCDGHGVGAFGAAEVGGFGAAGAGDTVRRGPDTIAIREIPLAARSSITDTTSP